MKYDDVIREWEAVNAVDPNGLTDARLTAHWLAQIIGATGEALVPPESDFSHTSMSWSNDRRALLGRATPRGTQVALRLPDLSLHVLRSDGRDVSTSLDGLTLQNALRWTVNELERAEGGPLARNPEIPEYEMPEHPVGSGAAIAPPSAERLEELARWYANADRLAGFVRANTLGASPVRCWPHHFDIATLVTLDPPGTDPDTARSIGFGLSPGDASYVEPYFYINPWPFPARRDGHPPLAGGAHWHTEGWFGAVLPASAIEGSAAAQAEQVLEYAKSAMAADRIILGTL